MIKIIKITQGFKPQDGHDLVLKILEDLKVEHKVTKVNGELIIEYYKQPNPNNIQKPIN